MVTAIVTDGRDSANNVRARNTIAEGTVPAGALGFVAPISRRRATR